MVIDWTTMGCPEPTGTPAIHTVGVGLRVTGDMRRNIEAEGRRSGRGREGRQRRQSAVEWWVVGGRVVGGLPASRNEPRTTERLTGGGRWCGGGETASRHDGITARSRGGAAAMPWRDCTGRRRHAGGAVLGGCCRWRWRSGVGCDQQGFSQSIPNSPPQSGHGIRVTSSESGLTRARHLGHTRYVRP